MDVADHRQTRATRLDDLLAHLDERLQAGATTDFLAVATGFKVLDDSIGGGLRAGDLVLVGGPPGVGKTIVTLQMARNVALAGGHPVFVCYEHDETALAIRLMALELAEGGDDLDAARQLPRQLLTAAERRTSLADVVAGEPAMSSALDRLRAYAYRMTLVRGSGAHTTLDRIDELVQRHVNDGDEPVLFIDYLQKVPVLPEPSTESEKVTRTVEHLKDLALTHHVPVVAISAVDTRGMDARRLRLHHLRGSSAVAFEADVVLMLNDKARAVSKVHLAYDSIGAKRFRDWVVMSVEKNRGGPNLIDLEFRKDFSHFRFDPNGGMVTEKLVDERLDDELA